MSNIRGKEYTQYLNKQVYNIYLQNFLPEVQALYTFSPPHPPTQMISFQQRSSMQKKKKKTNLHFLFGQF